jgi:TRAP-type C4-dicarboxylate transport system permease small subunit
MAPLIIHAVLAIVGIRLGLYCVMAWQRLRLKHSVASSVPSGRERFFLLALPVVALLMAGMVVNSGLAVIGLLGNPAP